MALVVPDGLGRLEDSLLADKDLLLKGGGLFVTPRRLTLCHGKAARTHLTVTVLPGSHMSSVQIHFCSASLWSMHRESCKQEIEQARIDKRTFGLPICTFFRPFVLSVIAPPGAVPAMVY